VERVGEAALALGQAAGDCEGGPVAGALKQLDVLVTEAAPGQGPHVHDADHAALHEQRDAQQRAEALVAQDRVEDVGLLDVLDLDGLPGRRDAPREPLPDRDLDPAFDLLLEALGRPRHVLSSSSSSRIAAVSASRIATTRASSSFSRGGTRARRP
jgi:hypothetical protein